MAPSLDLFHTTFTPTNAVNSHPFLWHEELYQDSTRLFRRRFSKCTLTLNAAAFHIFLCHTYCHLL